MPLPGCRRSIQLAVLLADATSATINFPFGSRCLTTRARTASPRLHASDDVEAACSEFMPAFNGNSVTSPYCSNRPVCSGRSENQMQRGAFPASLFPPRDTATTISIGESAARTSLDALQVTSAFCRLAQISRCELNFEALHGLRVRWYSRTAQDCSRAASSGLRSRAGRFRALSSSVTATQLDEGMADDALHRQEALQAIGYSASLVEKPTASVLSDEELSAAGITARDAAARIRALTKAGDIDGALRALQPELQARRLALAAMWDAAVIAAAEGERTDIVLNLLQQMGDAGVPVGYVANGTAINTLCKAGRIQEALKYLDKLLATGEATSAMCRMVMTAGMAAGDNLATRAALTADDMLCALSKAPRSIDTWAQVIRFKGVERGATAAEASFTEAQKACGAVAPLHEAFISALAAADALPQALASLEDLLDVLPAPVTPRTDRPLAAAWEGSSMDHASGGDNVGGGSGDGSGRRSLPRGTQIAAADVAAAAEKAFDMSSARAVVQLVTQAGYDAPALLWNTAVRAAVKGGSDPDTIDDIVEDMLLAGVTADHHTFVAMATGYAAAGDVQRCASVLDFMQNAGVRPQRHAFNTVLSAAAQHGDLQLCRNVYQRMIDTEEPADQATFVALFSCIKYAAAALSDNASWQSAAAMGVSPQLRAEAGESDTPSMHFGMQQKQEMGVALDEWWTHLRQSEIAFSPALLTSLVQALSHLQQMEEACKLVEKAAAGTLGSQVEGANLPPQACAAALGGCARSGRTNLSIRIRRTMERAGLALGVHAYQALISTCAWAGDIPAALSLRRDMLRGGIPPSVWVENALLRVHCLAGDLEGAMQVFHRLPALRLHPDSQTWHILMSAAQHSRRADFGAQILALIPQEERPKWDHRLDWARGISETGELSDPLPLYASSDDDEWGS